MESFFVPGFKTASAYAGIKEKGPDVALFYSEIPAVTVGYFTRNSLRAIPVVISERVLNKRGKAQAIIVNSGNANAATGKKGELATMDVVKGVAQSLVLEDEMVLPASTGVIGEVLPADKIKGVIPELVRKLSKDGWEDSARAIMTTDTVPKMSYRKFTHKDEDIYILGIAKGAGMIQPGMATMLAFIFTNALITEEELRRLATPLIDDTFNSISVDGEMSTNDSVYIMANGFSSEPILRRTDGCRNFRKALRDVLTDLALKIVDDGEGATHRVEIEVQGAKNRAEARKIAYRLANSPLLKTAIAGNDPNWGRIYAAMGSLEIPLEPEELHIEMAGVPLYRWGELPTEDLLKEAAKKMKERIIPIKVTLKRGKAGFKIYTTDLTCEYVKINADYHT